MRAVFGPGSSPLRGQIRVPGDKSLSHRAVLFSAMADGTSRLSGVLDAEDVRSTISAVEMLGAVVALEKKVDGSLAGTITGWGTAGPRPMSDTIDCGNSGTTARLLLGVLAGWPIAVKLVGDVSLSSRPMRRVTEPLAGMGARFATTPEGTLPVTVDGATMLDAIDYASPVASAQVKTALLLAGTRAKGRTTLTEPAPSRDHTERLLPGFGVPVLVDPERSALSVDGPTTLTAAEVRVPGDPSSAAFFAVAAALVPDSNVFIEGVSLNPTRVGFIRVLERMGVSIDVLPDAASALEPMGDVRVRYSPELAATAVEAAEVPSLIDEVPVLALTAARASGTTTFEGVGELRVKESDRLTAIVRGLSKLGADASSRDDLLLVGGPATLGGAELDASGDHRLAMTWAVAGLAAEAPVGVIGFDATSVSYPGFAGDLDALRAES